ncbi:MAG TPA: MraY family glycosyltransferase [Candidatus Limnocylindrales bacterium]|nr:MraY family glycosyltransferase [Candidatus Limnocylindrales bacterium]
MTLIEHADRSYFPIIVVFTLAALIAFVLTPLVRRTMIQYGVVDRPNARRVNTRPIPRAGGIAIAVGFLVVALPFTLLNEAADWVPTPLNITANDLFALFAGGAAAAAIGVLDDLYDLRARWQLLGQVCLALAAWFLGIGVSLINNPFAEAPLRFAPAFSVGFTVFWIVGMINSINWIDGLDGLSTGVALIASVTLGILSLTTQVSQPLIAVLCFALAGALLGFLRWNFHPAKIFTGTTGVQFVGYTLGVLSILGSAKVAVALLVLGVPIIDTFWIIVGRLSQGRSPFTPDRSHIHHRLLDLGLSHRNTVLFIYAICIALGILALLVQEVGQAYAFISLFILAGLILFGPTRGAFDRPDELEADAYDDDDDVQPPIAETSRRREVSQEP